jgi:LL-diaminopimelate aminotransferase
MARINENFLKLKSSYLFSEVAKRIVNYQAANPGKEIIKMSIGDVTRALPMACIEAFHKAVDEMAKDSTFKGYSPEAGHVFLQEAIAKHDFQAYGVDINPDEVFISDGAKSDVANFQELFDVNSIVAIPDPVYPVYMDTNVMAGRTGNLDGVRYEKVVYLDCTEANHFVPELPKKRADLIYMCFPNNPTGATITKDEMKKWVDYARDNKSIILFDACYVEFLRDKSIPRSIFEIPGAKEVAVEFRSFSKTAGFTGTRCAYTIVPKECRVSDSKGGETGLHGLWFRRQSTKFNGVSYPVQRAAQAVFSAEGKKQVKEIIDSYLKNAKLVRETFQGLGYKCIGGENSPYIWINVKTDSWKFFDMMLDKAGVVITPGAGFGKCGEGYIRISAFNSYANVEKAMEKCRRLL